MKHTLILYESRYGFTKKVAEQAALVLGPSKCMHLSELKGDGGEWDLIVLLYPVYSEWPDQSAVSRIKENFFWIHKHKVVVLCTCLAVQNSKRYLKPILELLGDCVVYHKAITGNLYINQLRGPDKEQAADFFQKTGREAQDYNCFNQTEYIETLLKIKEWKDCPKAVMDEKKLLHFSEEFLVNHDTCSLSTGYGQRVRATPVEYRYQEGFLYILSEGGEKFANILLNPQVSVAIFNEFQGMNQLRGMQITGIAELIETGSKEYLDFLSLRNLKYEQVLKLPVVLHLIRIRICKMEFLWSGFQDMGVDIKQIHSF